jgi:ribosomal subunit interface protein
MTFIVQSKTLPVTDAMRQFAEAQAQKILKTGQRVEKITLFLETVKRRKNDVKAMTAKFNIDIPGKNIVITRHARDMYEAIVEAANRSTRYLLRQKEKRVTAKRMARNNHLDLASAI